MPLHPEARALLRRFEALGDPPIESSTPDAVRALRASRIRPPTVSLAEIRDVDAGGVPARLYRPSAGPALGLVLYFHGGGWVLGSVDTHDHVTRALAAESGCAVLSVDYRLAPEHPFPAGLDDAFAVSAWTHANARSLGCDPDRLAVGGDSAGANLAAVVTQSGLPVPVPAPRLSGHRRPWWDGIVRGARRWVLADEGRHGLVRQALPLGRRGLAVRPAGITAARGRRGFRGLPRTLVITAELDPLRDEGEATRTGCAPRGSRPRRRAATGCSTGSSRSACSSPTEAGSDPGGRGARPGGRLHARGSFPLRRQPQSRAPGPRRRNGRSAA